MTLHHRDNKTHRLPLHSLYSNSVSFAGSSYCIAYILYIPLNGGEEEENKKKRKSKREREEKKKKPTTATRKRRTLNLFLIVRSYITCEEDKIHVYIPVYIYSYTAR